ncbi:MAG: ABC transporter ATP-binding protein [bacterium]
MSHDTFIEDDRISGTADPRLTLRLLRFVVPYWRMILASSVISLVLALLQIAGPCIVKITIDDGIAKNNTREIILWSGLFLATVIMGFALEYAQGMMITWVGQRSMFDLRSAMFAHVQRLSVAFFDRHPVGRLMTRLTSDVQALNELFSQGIMTLAGDIFLLIGIAVIMLSIDAKLSLLVFATGPLLFLAGSIFRREVRIAYRDARARLSRMNAYLQENICGMRTVQAYNRQSSNFSLFSAMNDSYRAANKKTIFYHAVFFPVVELIAAIALALIVWYGGVSTLHGTITLGTVFLFIQFTHRFFQPIRELTEKFNVFQTALASGERIIKLLDTPVDVASPARPCPFNGLSREIRFDHVWFAYKGEEWVLHDVSFTVERGQTVALVGHTGSGKTTITSLLARYYDIQRGAITIDGINIRDIDLVALRRQMAVVMQDVFLFTGDIASNIRLGDTTITDDAVRQCAQYVNAASFIESLDGDYRHEVRERGATLSVGQKQLLAFARALAFDPQILILDEATASIDTETELLIQDALEKLLRGRTAIVIAHRLSTIQHADKIIVLHHGCVRETGSHDELLRREGIYHKLYKLQYKGNGQASPAAPGKMTG